MKIYVRPKYLQRVRPFIGSELVKVFTGIRRCGKSTVMDMVISEIKSKGIKEDNILKMDFESKRTPHFIDGDSLYEYIIKWASGKDGKLYIFLDEIQEIDGWETCIRSLIRDIDSDIYLTGSSSKMLSGELATHIAGRYVEIGIDPFSFNEVTGILYEDDIAALFGRFMKNGGMPLVVMSGYDLMMTPSILSAMYDSVIVNDIAKRNSVRDIAALMSILQYAVSEIGHTMPAKRISDYLKSQKKNVSVDTVIDYLGYAEDAMFLRKLRRYDIRGKELLKTECKYYLTDIGVRESLGFSNAASIDQVLENIVCNELVTRGFNVSIGKINDHEIDFVATKGSDIEYYQVAYMIASEDTAEREFGSLISIADNHPKYVISMDTVDMSRDGIVHRNIIDWLNEG